MYNLKDIHFRLEIGRSETFNGQLIGRSKKQDSLYNTVAGLVSFLGAQQMMLRTIGKRKTSFRMMLYDTSQGESQLIGETDKGSMGLESSPNQLSAIIGLLLINFVQQYRLTPNLLMQFVSDQQAQAILSNQMLWHQLPTIKELSGYAVQPSQTEGLTRFLEEFKNSLRRFSPFLRNTSILQQRLEENLKLISPSILSNFLFGNYGDIDKELFRAMGIYICSYAIWQLSQHNEPVFYSHTLN